MAELFLELARESDIAELDHLILTSAQTLCARYYEPRVVAAAIQHIFGVDSQLVRAGCYFAARVRGEIIACGGWSPFATLFGSDNAGGRNDRRLDPRLDSARIRAFFVSPEWTRAGVGSAMLDMCETAAVDAGFSSCELMATLSGVPFYEARGYVARGDHVVDLDGTRVRFVPMHKALAAPAGAQRPLARHLTAMS